jgi:hypothetical protein
MHTSARGGAARELQRANEQGDAMSMWGADDLVNATQASEDGVWGSASAAGLAALQGSGDAPGASDDITTGRGGGLADLRGREEAMEGLFGNRFDDSSGPKPERGNRLMKKRDWDTLYPPGRNRAGELIDDKGVPIS